MCPRKEDKSSMSVFAWADDLERREAQKRGVPRVQARPFLASKMGLLPGTLENIVRKRIKEPKQRIVDAVRNAFIRELEAEIQSLTHSLEMARLTSAHPASDEIREAETLLAQAKALIKS